MCFLSYKKMTLLHWQTAEGRSWVCKLQGSKDHPPSSHRDLFSQWPLGPTNKFDTLALKKSAGFCPTKQKNPRIHNEVFCQGASGPSQVSMFRVGLWPSAEARARVEPMERNCLPAHILQVAFSGWWWPCCCALHSCSRTPAGQDQSHHYFNFCHPECLFQLTYPASCIYLLFSNLITVASTIEAILEW